MRCNSRKRTKTLVWTQIDRCVFDDNENAYFWKRVSVERALEQQCLEKNGKRVSVSGASGPRCESSLVTSPLSSVHFDVTVLAIQVRSLVYGSLYSCCFCLAVASLWARGFTLLEFQFGNRSSRHQRSRYQEVDSSPTNSPPSNKSNNRGVLRSWWRFGWRRVNFLVAILLGGEMTVNLEFHHLFCCHN